MDSYNDIRGITTCRGYWLKTGCKFIGTDEELMEKLVPCGHLMPWTDEEGWFGSFLCCKDFKECDKNCSKHRPLINLMNW